MTVKFEWKIPKIPLFNPKQANALFDKQINKSLNTMTTVVQTNISFDAPAGATGRLKNSIGTSISTNKGRVFTGVNYAPVIEKGRKAAPVSSSADIGLRNWIRQSTKGKLYFSGLKSRYPKITLKSAIFLLKRSMKRKKRKPNPFFSRGVKRSEKRLRLESGILLRNLAIGLMR